MTALSREILEKYQMRKTKKQKMAFIQLLKQYFPQLAVQTGGFPKCRNIMIGDIEKAKIVISAHYDTCALLPFPNFIAPKNPVLSICYSVLLIIPVFATVWLANLLLGLLTANYWAHHWLSVAIYFGYFFLMIAGPANKHTANDNTSGVIALCELLQTLSPDVRSKAAFVLFDHEETGLIGSSFFRHRYKKIMTDKLLINLDCIADGDNILVSANKAARDDFGDALKKAFLPNDNKTILFTKAEKTYYPSDQKGFKKAVAVAALKRKQFVGYYMDRIHTNRDVIFQKDNIKLVCDCIRNLLITL